MLYGAANRDEEIFGADAEEFRIRRHPNRHLQFGFGEHICIGAHLARLEARVMFEELLPLLDRTALAGPVVRIRSSMVPGVRHMPVRMAA
jgi:cytochrome P450